jgi:hypothetical protein
MPLQDLKAECEIHEARLDGAHSKIDKFGDQGSKGGSEPTESAGKKRARLGWKSAVTGVGVMAMAAAMLWYLGAIPIGSDDNDRVTNTAPVINSWSVINSVNGMMIRVNASDMDNDISNVYIAAYANTTQLGSPVFEKVYWVNQSNANITDILILGNLPAGNYIIEAHAVDEAGKESNSSGFREFTVPP